MTWVPFLWRDHKALSFLQLELLEVKNQFSANCSESGWRTKTKFRLGCLGVFSFSSGKRKVSSLWLQCNTNSLQNIIPLLDK